MGELEQIALIEQAQLQGAALHQGADLRTLERGDPGQPVERAQGVDRFVRDHPPIPDQHQTMEGKLLPQLIDLRHQRAPIRRVALVHRGRHRTAATRRQQSVVDLQGVAFAVAAVADLCHRTAVALEVTGTQVIQRQPTLG